MLLVQAGCCSCGFWNHSVRRRFSLVHLLCLSEAAVTGQVWVFIASPLRHSLELKCPLQLTAPAVILLRACSGCKPTFEVAAICLFQILQYLLLSPILPTSPAAHLSSAKATEIHNFFQKSSDCIPRSESATIARQDWPCRRVGKF